MRPFNKPVISCIRICHFVRFDKVKPSNHAENQLVTFWRKKSGDQKGFTCQRNIFTEKGCLEWDGKTKLDLFFSVMFELPKGNNASNIWITNLLCDYENNMAQKMWRRYRPACLSFDSLSLSCLCTGCTSGVLVHWNSISRNWTVRMHVCLYACLTACLHPTKQ